MASLYQRLNMRIRNLSLVTCALTMGIIGFVTSIGVGEILFNEFDIIQAVILGLILGGIYYFNDPR